MTNGDAFSITTVGSTGKIKHRKENSIICWETAFNNKRQQHMRTGLEGVYEVSIFGSSQEQAEQTSAQIDICAIDRTLSQKDR